MLSISTSIILISVIVIALIFALSNGLHDASSVVATFIICGAATPKQAIGVASVFGLLGAILGGSAVADTISKVIDLPVNPFLLKVLLAAMLGAVIWNIITWRLGLPSSSTHALIGGIIGAVWVSSGSTHILWGFKQVIGLNHQITGIVKVVAALIISPLLGFIVAFILQKISRVLLRNAKFTINKPLKRIQWVIAAILAYSHGANDTQKIFGIITLALVAGGNVTMNATPLWVRLSGGMVMFIGTMLGGWSIIKTIGRGIYSIGPIHSTNSQLASVGSILIATIIGAPVSTTHVVVGSVIGVGASDEYKMVHWGIAKEIIMAWFITIPLTAIVSALVYLVLNLIFKVI
ncbi:inorganic phosphate transporter [Clostridium estertheticum]|uniref:inorganic phosphate transporter n=1 Tax=Clostridium estertheticum TaxID=238834 RepID=UPI0013E8F8A7|nr:inorganic phosphate transporter [Clostridium estertheticum]MBZ9686865.1 inorganic phosphate transporter [Clostridium estertheticum]